MKKLFALLLCLAMILSIATSAFAAPVPVRSLTEAEEEFVQDNFDLDYGWEFIRWVVEDIGPRGAGNYGIRKIMDKARAEWESFGYETHLYTGPAAAWSAGGTKPVNPSQRHNAGYLHIQGMKDGVGDPLKIVYVGPDYNANSVYKFGGKLENRWDNEEIGPVYKNDVAGIVILDWSGTGTNGAPNAPITVPEGVDVAGKTVVVRNMTNTPTPTSATATALNNPSAANYYGSALNLQTAGAAAVVFQTARNSPAYQITQDGIPGIWINEGNNSFSRMAQTVASDTTTDITIPVGMTLYTYTNDLLANMTPDELANAKIDYMMEYHDQIYQAWAVKKAKVPTDKTIYFTAHTDSYTGTAPFGPGGNDNISGAGLVMAVSKAYANVDTNVNLVFYLNDCEERGLWGAYHFVNNMTHEEKLGFLANYNFDMVATAQENVQYLSLGTPNARLGTLRSQMNNPFGYLWDVPEAVEIAQGLGSIFNTYAYVAPRTGLLLPKNIIFTQSTGSDHRTFFQGATYFEEQYPNMTNAWHFDWRRRPYGANEFEAVYHKIGDNLAGMSRERFDIAAEVSALTLGYDLGVLSGPVQAGVQAFWFEIETDKELVKPGDYVTLTPRFGNSLSSNAAVLNLKFDKDIFEYRGYEGLELLNTEETDEGIKLTVGNLEEYNLTSLGNLLFSVKDDVNKGENTIELIVEYVFKDANDVKAVATAGAGYEFTTIVIPEDGYSLIDLSNIIDIFGTVAVDKGWAEAKFWDFNSNGEIDIFDITFVAQLIK